MIAGYLALLQQPLSVKPAWPKQLEATTTSTSPQGSSKVIRVKPVPGSPTRVVASQKDKRPKKHGTPVATKPVTTPPKPTTQKSLPSAKPIPTVPGAPMNTSNAGSESSTGSLPGEGDGVGGSGGG
jgi:hypothetical protein